MIGTGPRLSDWIAYLITYLLLTVKDIAVSEQCCCCFNTLFDWMENLCSRRFRVPGSEVDDHRALGSGAVGAMGLLSRMALVTWQGFVGSTG